MNDHCPMGLAVEPAGRILVSDPCHGFIDVLDTGGTWTQEWGGLGSGDGQFGGGPSDCALDSDGNVYALDALGRVLEFTGAGEFVRAWGANGSAPGQLNRPRSITVDANNQIYVADSGNNRIEIFDEGGTFLAAFGSSGMGPGEFAEPMGLAVDASGNIYVADHGNNRIQKFGQTIAVTATTWATVKSLYNR